MDARLLLEKIGRETRRFSISWKRLYMKKKRISRQKKLAALKAESDRELTDMIRRLLDKPMNQRTHFLRKRIGFRGSAL